MYLSIYILICTLICSHFLSNHLNMENKNLDTLFYIRKQNEQVKKQLLMNALEKKNFDTQLVYIREQNKQLCKQLLMNALVENNLDGKIKPGEMRKPRWDCILKESMKSPRSLPMESMKRPSAK